MPPSLAFGCGWVTLLGIESNGIGGTEGNRLSSRDGTGSPADEIDQNQIRVIRDPHVESRNGTEKRLRPRSTSRGP
jgi:hypothetical protein